MPRSTGVRGDLQIAFINGPQVPRQADGLMVEPRGSTNQSAAGALADSGVGEGGISGHDAIKGLSMFPPKNIRPPPSAIPGNG